MTAVQAAAATGKRRRTPAEAEPPPSPVEAKVVAEPKVSAEKAAKYYAHRVKKLLASPTPENVAAARKAVAKGNLDESDFTWPQEAAEGAVEGDAGVPEFLKRDRPVDPAGAPTTVEEPDAEVAPTAPILKKRQPAAAKPLNIGQATSRFIAEDISRDNETVAALVNKSVKKKDANGRLVAVSTNRACVAWYRLELEKPENVAFRKRMLGEDHPMVNSLVFRTKQASKAIGIGLHTCQILVAQPELKNDDVAAAVGARLSTKGAPVSTNGRSVAFYRNKLKSPSFRRRMLKRIKDAGLDEQYAKQAEATTA